MVTLDQKIALYAILHNPIDFRQFFFKDLDGNPWKVYFYQIPWALSRDVVVQCGRNVGKSDEIPKEILRRALLQPNRQTMVATQQEVHLKPPCESLINMLYTHPFFRLFKGKVTRSPDYRINIGRHEVFGRSAGTQMGNNFLGPHVDNIFVDEAQTFQDICLKKITQAVRDATASWRFYGVHDGRRDTALYKKGYEDPEFRDKAFNYPSYVRPGWTDEEKRRLAREYGGEGSPEWVHNVLGLPGEVSYGVWPYEDLASCVSTERFLEDIVITDKDLEEVMDKNEAREKGVPWFSLEALPLPPLSSYGLNPTKVIGGYDATYSGDPAVLLLAFKEKGKWVIPFRIQLLGIIPNDQAFILNYIMDIYKVDLLGIDTTGADGKNVRDNLGDKPIYSVVFSANIVTGYDEEGKPREINAKEYSTLLGLTALKNKDFLFYESPSIMEEFLGERARRAQGGKMIYMAKKDHTLSAFRCLNLAIWASQAPIQEEGGEFFFDYMGEWGNIGKGF